MHAQMWGGVGWGRGSAYVVQSVVGAGHVISSTAIETTYLTKAIEHPVRTGDAHSIPHKTPHFPQLSPTIARNEAAATFA